MGILEKYCLEGPGFEGPVSIAADRDGHRWYFILLSVDLDRTMLFVDVDTLLPIRVILEIDLGNGQPVFLFSVAALFLLISWLPPIAGYGKHYHQNNDYDGDVLTRLFHQLLYPPHQ